jgi:hypothetical protein
MTAAAQGTEDVVSLLVSKRANIECTNEVLECYLCGSLFTGGLLGWGGGRTCGVQTTVR